MALNYTVSYKKNANSRLFPAIAIANPQLYGNDQLRLTINMRGVDGRFNYEPRYGATVSFVDGMFEIDGTALAINDFLSTLFYASVGDGGTDATTVEVALVRHIGVGSILERVDSGVINFISRGFAPGEFPPVQPFSPVWVTKPGTILEITEGETKEVTLVGVLSTTMAGFAVPYLGSLRVVSVPADHSVEAVLINGSEIPRADFDHNIDVLSITAPILNTDVVEIRLSTSLIYTMNYGALPPGLTMGPDGHISGTLGVLPNAKLGVTQTFAFGVRVNTGENVYRDRRFVIKANPTTESQDKPVWVEPAPVSGVQTIGLYTRGAPISYVIQTTAPGGVAGTLSETASSQTTDENFSGLPAGVSLTPSGVVTGIIDPTTKVGTHYFAASLRDSRGVEVADSPRQFSLRVTSPSGPLEPLRFVRWRTPAGSVGTFYEGQVCPVGVRAYSTTGEAVTYTILATTPLPAGITIDGDTGDLQGIFSHVEAETSITFTARAAVGNTFIDRDFTLTVLPRYNSSGAVNVSFRLRRNEAAPMIEDYEPLIPSDDFFRANDPNFGKLKEPVIYVIGGLRKADEKVSEWKPNIAYVSGQKVSLDGIVYSCFISHTSSGSFDSSRWVSEPSIDQYPEPVEYVAAAIRNSRFGGPIKVRLGAHKVAMVKLGGVVVYEVLYREVIDPLDRAGGFTLNTRGEPVRSPLRYPQSSGRFIYPESIKNVRYDLTLQVGFDAFDTTQNIKLGANSPENLPQWMTTPQIGNQQSSIIGFVPAMVVAYLKPGAGQRALDKLSLRAASTSYPLDEPNPLAKNHEVSFDQYYLSYDSMSQPTMFDNGTTTFDGEVTRFDEYAYQKGKYQRMNPKGGN